MIQKKKEKGKTLVGTNQKTKLKQNLKLTTKIVYKNKKIIKKSFRCANVYDSI